MKTLRSVWRSLETLRGCFLASVSAQASKWAPFCSPFWACFRKTHPFSEGLRRAICDIKPSMLAASAWALRIVAVRSYCEVLLWQI